MNLVNINNRNKSTSPYFTDVFDSIFNNSLGGNQFKPQSPKINLAENKQNYVIELAVPGLSKEDIKVELNKDSLTISFEKKTNNEEQNYTRKEFELFSFKKSFIIPEHVDVENITATCVNGLLEVNLPKKEQVKDIVKEIDVK